MKYHIITYGCQMNVSDSEKIASRLKNAGYKPAQDAKKADIIAVNFCSVRQSAVHRALAQLQTYKDKRLIAAGCLLSQDQKKLAQQNIAIWHPDDYYTEPPLRHNKFSAFVPIMTGCNNFCSYCAVPFTRGREKSRPAQEIIAEIKQILKKGVKEIILLGQNVNSYRGNRGMNSHSAASAKKGEFINFPQLLRLINSLPDDFWLTFITSHPKDMSDELISAMVECQKIIPYLHLPVQSGDDKILKAMNRHYSVAHYKNLVKKIRLAFKKHRPAFAKASVGKPPFPPLAISTDIIVGFPGETAEQFQNTLKLIKDIKFDMIYFARYSSRPGTRAARLADNVPPREKKCRAQIINAQLKKDTLALNKKYLNQKVEVLIDKIEGKFAFGRTATNKGVMILSKNLKIGQIKTVRITGAKAWNLKGLEKPH